MIIQRVQIIKILSMYALMVFVEKWLVWQTKKLDLLNLLIIICYVRLNQFTICIQVADLLIQHKNGALTHFEFYTVHFLSESAEGTAQSVCVKHARIDKAIPGFLNHINTIL